MIELPILFFHLIVLTAFVPADDGGYVEWDIVIMEDHDAFLSNCGFQVEIENGTTVACSYSNMKIMYIWEADVYVPVDFSGGFVSGLTYHLLRLW